MAKDHYIPALLLGRFSNDLDDRVRNRTVYVCRRGSGRVRPSRVSRLGYVNNLYGANNSSLNVDSSLTGYERQLRTTLDRVERAHKIDLETWLRVLVPFVASMFVRGFEFSERFEARPIVNAVRAAGLVDEDNTNRARLMEMQLLLAPVMCARWVVMHHRGQETFIINDLGLMGTRDVPRAESGWAIPIGLRTIIGIFPRQIATIAHHQRGSWVPVLEHREVGTHEFHGANQGMAHFATQWIAGCDPTTVEKYRQQLEGGPDDPSRIMNFWPFTHRALVTHKLEWYRLVSATASSAPPDQIAELQSVDWSSISKGYLPAVVHTLNQAAEMPTGLIRRGGNISLSLHEVDNYGDYFIHP